jgi:N-methylhydantoinase A
MALDADGAADAIGRRLGAALDVSAVRAAWGVHETINEDVARAFRNHASERGFDYRRSAMIAFGGSGPAHAARVARKLRVPEVILPAAAGVMSAVGMLFSPLTFEALRSHRVALDGLSVGAYEDIFAGVAAEASAALGSGTGAAAVTRSLDMRYIGQGYDIEVTIPDGLPPADQVAALPALFAEAYERVFFKSFPDKPIEIVSWKAELRGPRPPTGLDRCSLASVSGGTARKGTRRAYFPEAGGYTDCPVYDRYALTSDSRITGPALIEENEATCVIGVGDSVTVDGFGNLVVAIASEAIQQGDVRS